MPDPTMRIVRALPDYTVPLPAGYAQFNGRDHAIIDVPDCEVTFSFRDSIGRTLTVYFGNYGPTDDNSEDGPIVPTYVDIQHQTKARQPGRDDCPAFEAMGFGPGMGDPFDTRYLERSISVLCIPLDGTKHAEKLPEAKRHGATQFGLAARLKRSLELNAAEAGEIIAALKALPHLDGKLGYAERDALIAKVADAIPAA